MLIPPQYYAYRGEIVSEQEQKAPHFSDCIDIDQLCMVADEYVDSFLDFVSGLNVVPGYSYVQGDVEAVTLYSGTRVFAGSEDRGPNGASLSSGLPLQL